MKVVNFLLSLAILAAISLAVFWGIRMYLNNEISYRDSRIEKGFKSAQCEIVGQDFHKGHSVKYQFEYNGKKYGGWIQDYDKKIKIGEVFKVVFDSTNPVYNRMVK